jgi:hypothetical protein
MCEGLEPRLALDAGALLPLVGDWNGDGKDSLGLFAPATGSFLLRDVNAPGFPHRAVNVAAQISAISQPLAGDWNGDGSDTPGLFDPATGC